MSLITWDNLSLNTGSIVGTGSGRYATSGKIDGKWYWEIEWNTGNYIAIGVGGQVTGWIRDSILKTSHGFVRKNTVYVSGSDTFVRGSVIGVAIDVDEGTVFFYNNGVKMGEIPYNMSELDTKVYYPVVASPGTGEGCTATANFGATPFKYNVPEGYLPYDYENADWFNPNKYLFQCNDNILKPTMNGLELVEGTLHTQLFEEHGTDYLPDIIGQYDKEVDMVYKEDLEGKKIYGYKLVGYRNIDKLEVK